MSKYRKHATAALALLFGVSLQVFAPVSYATGGIGAIWNQVAYPASSSDNNASDSQGFFCALCHATADGTGYNPYGNAMRPLIGGNSTTDEIVQALKSLEALNSDGDLSGFSNIAEINANTQPGWKVGDTVPSTVKGLLDPVAAVPDIAVAPLSIDFGEVVIGATVSGTEVSITNAGSASLSITSLSLPNPVFTLGSQTPATPFSIEAGATAKVGVVYKPDNAGLDSGSLVIASNDPDEVQVIVPLGGTGVTTEAECFPSVEPATLAFGKTLLNTTRELSVTLRNSGVGNCVVAVSVPICVSGEFALRSPANVVVLPGTASTITVGYTPINVGLDQCRLDISTQAQDPVVPMSGEGVTVLPTDLDIRSFKTTKNVSLSKGSGIVEISISIENKGTGEGPGMLTVTGTQNGASFVNQVVRVSDRVGRGATDIILQAYIPTKTGTITWTATLQDGDPDIDQAMATTVVKP